MSISNEEIKRVSDFLTKAFCKKGLLNIEHYEISINPYPDHTFTLFFYTYCSRGLKWTKQRYKYLKELVNVDANTVSDSYIDYSNETFNIFDKLVGIENSKDEINKMDRLEDMLNNILHLEKDYYVEVYKDIKKDDSYCIGCFYRSTFVDWNYEQIRIIEKLLQDKVNISDDKKYILMNNNTLNTLYIVSKMLS